MKIITDTCQNIGKRTEQQDSLAVYEPESQEAKTQFGTLAVVADGMGGLQSGAEASSLAVKTFCAAYLSKTEEETIPNALRRSIKAANEDVYNLSVELDCEDNCGTTLIAVVIHESGLYWVYAGDSRIYVTAGEILQQLTTDQIYARKLDEALEKGVIDETTALKHPQREALTSYIGAKEIDEIGEGQMLGRLPDGLFILLCSDGLYKYLPDDEILDNIAKNRRKIAHALVETVISKRIPTQDNVSVISAVIASSDVLTDKVAAQRKFSAKFVGFFITAAILIGGIIMAYLSKK